jgi:mannose-1-phosphate guanylyltransferase
MRKRVAYRADQWALILAGGEGTRLRSLTRRISGEERPKQFCPIIGRESLLEQARRRARLLIEPARTLLILTRAHEAFYAPLLAETDPASVVVQPLGRGTAPAIVYGLLRIAPVSPTATVVILPSDHYVSHDVRFMAHVASGFAAVARHPDLVVLLGIQPDTAETEYGWIEPGDALPRSDLRSVRRFREKPTPTMARKLLAGGCLWNSFVTVARVATLLGVIRQAVPALDAAFRPIRVALGTAAEADAAQQVYARLSPIDFSVHVLAQDPAHLAVLPVTGISWTDLGQPRRVFAVLGALGLRPAWAVERSAESA